MTDTANLTTELRSLRPTFTVYVSFDEQKVFATQVTEKNVANIRTHWKPNAPVRLGDYVILRGDGRLEVFDETHFGDSFALPEDRVTIQA